MNIISQVFERLKKGKFRVKMLFGAISLTVFGLGIYVDNVLQIQPYLWGWRPRIFPVLMVVFFCLLYLFYNRLKNRLEARGGYKLDIVVLLILLFTMYFWLIPAIFIKVGSSQIYNYDNIELVPESKIVLVLGAGLDSDGTPSDVLEDRLITASELYKSGKVKKFLLSGDNRTEYYNEPKVMKKYLLQEIGIPEKDIVLDYAGRRTYDSCRRAKEIWGLDEFLIVTQEFHLYRSLYLCKKMGLQVYGVSADRHWYFFDAIMETRELLAMHKAVLDLYVKEPAFVGGDKEEIVW